MKMSGDEAVALLRKWENDSTEIRGMFETFPQGSGLVSFRGTVEVSEEGTLVVLSGGGFVELYLDISNAEFEYKDWREAPDRLKEWSKTAFESLLVALADSKIWRCSFFESKDTTSSDELST